MKGIAKNFLNGIVTIVPIILVIYVVIKVFEFLDGLLGNVFRNFLKDDYVPGMGLIASLILITLLGWLSRQYISGKVVSFIDRGLDRIPLIKSLYSIIKDTIHSFIGEKKSFSKVALVSVPGGNMKILGFVMTEEVEKFAEPLKDHIAIYVPQSFQVAGFTFLAPKEDIEILDVKPEEAMKFILSGGVTGKKGDTND